MILFASSRLNRYHIGRPIAAHLRYSLASHRRLSSSFTPPDIAPKTKPKSSTALRRSQAASASETIRKTSTPTRSDILPVITLATAERYALSHLRGALPASARVLHEAWHVPRWGDQRPGEIFIFANGSFVCWGLTETDARRFASQYLSNHLVGVRHIHEPEFEELEFVTDSEECVHHSYIFLLLTYNEYPDSRDCKAT
jgi:required for meiotic nuclear division protein 1